MEVVSDDFLKSIRVEDRKLKLHWRKRFYVQGETVGYTQNLLLLDHVIENLDQFKSFELLKSSAFDQFTLYIERVW